MQGDTALLSFVSYISTVRRHDKHNAEILQRVRAELHRYITRRLQKSNDVERRAQFENVRGSWRFRAPQPLVCETVTAI